MDQLTKKTPRTFITTSFESFAQQSWALSVFETLRESTGEKLNILQQFSMLDASGKQIRENNTPKSTQQNESSDDPHFVNLLNTRRSLRVPTDSTCSANMRDKKCLEHR